MKLHLPCRLRAAVLACLTAVASFVPTLATGAMAGGVVLYALSAPAYADPFVFNDTNNTNMVVTPKGDSTSDYNYIREDATSITFQTTSGYFNGSSSTDLDILINGNRSPETTGLVLTNASAGPNITFSGTVTGDGLISKTGAGSGTVLKFTGDVTQYTGNIIFGTNASPVRTTFTIQFGDGGTAPNTTTEHGVSGTGSITFNTSGTNKLIYNYGESSSPVYITNTITRTNNIASTVSLSGAANYYFTKDVTITSLAFNDTASATFTSGTVSGITNGRLSIAGAVTLSGTNTIESLTVANDGGLTLSGTNTISSFTIAGSGSVTLGGTVSLSNSITLSDNGNLTLASDVIFNLDGLTPVVDNGIHTYTIVSEGNADLSSLSTANISLTDGTNGILGKNWTFGTDGTISYTVSTPSDLTFGGDSLTWNTSDASFEGNATFTQ